MNNGRGALEKLVVGLMIAVLFVNGFNIYQMQGMENGVVANQVSGMANSVPNENDIQSDLVDVMPKGMPRIYGSELGVGYGDIDSSNQQKADAAIKKLGMLDQQIKLSGADKDRYVRIVSGISCEYCCGVESIINKDGSAACGCAHSFAMRGVAKYLIKNHPNEFTDDEILEELSKWKILFFPSQMAQKAAVMEAKGIELDYTSLASNKYRGIEN